MAVDTFVKVAGAWRPPTDGTDEMYVKVAGAWRTVTDHYVKVNGIWREAETPQPPKPPAGTYILGATALSLGSQTTGYAEFDTSVYQGYITEVRARVSYGSFSGTFKFNWYGRPSGSYYRQTDVIYPGNTIDHRMDTFSGNVLPQFNNGSAIGFTFTKPAGTAINVWIKNVQLNLTIS